MGQAFAFISAHGNGNQRPREIRADQTFPAISFVAIFNFIFIVPAYTALRVFASPSNHFNPTLVMSVLLWDRTTVLATVDLSGAREQRKTVINPSETRGYIFSEFQLVNTVRNPEKRSPI